MSALRSRALSTGLMAIGLGWLAYMLVTNLSHPALFIPASWSWLTVASLFVLLSIAGNGVLFYLFLKAAGCDHCTMFQALKMHYYGQLLRYLPGRIWGVVYQVSAAQRAIPAHQVVRANLDWMVFSILANTLVAMLLIAISQGWPWWILLTLLVVCLSILGLLFLGGTNWMLRRSANVLPNKLNNLLHALAEAKLTPRRMMLIVTVFILSWMLYLFGWILLSKVFPVFAHVDFIVLCAYYSLASVVGIVSAITPAGLGIREAAFMMMAVASMGAETVAFFALFGRVWLMVLEVGLLLVPLGLYLNERRYFQCR